MSKFAIDVRIRAGFLGLDASSSRLVELEGDYVDARVIGFVNDVFGVVSGCRDRDVIGSDGSRTASSRLLSSAGPQPEVRITVADGASDGRETVSARDFEQSVRDLRGRYEDAMWAHVAPGPVDYKSLATVRARPFNILVSRRGQIFVRYGFTGLNCDADAYWQITPLVYDADGEEIGGGEYVVHPEALTRTAGQTCGGSRVGYHDVPAGRFFSERVASDWRGSFDLDAIDDVVSRLRAEWGDLDAQINIPPSRLYRRSGPARAAA